MAKKPAKFVYDEQGKRQDGKARIGVFLRAAVIKAITERAAEQQTTKSRVAEAALEKVFGR